MSTLDEASTQELADELFSRSDWREAKFPSGTKVERGKAMSMNTQEEVWDDALEGQNVWPVIRLGEVQLGDVLGPKVAEGFWRTHADSFRQYAKAGASADKELFQKDPSAALEEGKLETCYEHREENTVGMKQTERNGEVPIFEISAREAGEIKSQNQKVNEARQKVREIAEELGLSMEEAMEKLT